MGQRLAMDGKEGGRGYLVVQMFNVLLYRINKLSLVSCIAPRIYTSVVQQKDHNRQKTTYPWPNEKVIKPKASQSHCAPCQVYP